MRSFPAPFEPGLTSELDVQNFLVDDIDQRDECDISSASAADQTDFGDDIDLPFIGYTYKRFDALRESHA
jgi:protein-serine/threonine kinase